jgi:hypothetical protein
MTMTAKVSAAPMIETPPVATAPTAKLKRINAVASLTRPSPSRIVRILFGTERRRAMAIGATASGGETTAPRTNPTAHGKLDRRESRCKGQRGTHHHQQYGLRHPHAARREIGESSHRNHRKGDPKNRVGHGSAPIASPQSG